MALRRADPPPRAGLVRRFYARVAGGRVGRAVSRRIFWKLDPVLLRATRGRFASPLLFPTAILETTGARTGQRREHAVIYFHDGDDVIVVASNAGAATDPAWFHNLRRGPRVVVSGAPMTARLVDDPAERGRLWDAAVRVFPAYDRYRVDAARHGRVIPVVRLTAREP